MTTFNNSASHPKATRLDFRLIRAATFKDVEDACNREMQKEIDTIAELSTGRTHSSEVRNPGTVQCSTWTFKKPSDLSKEEQLFVVVRRNDRSWAESVVDEKEKYALVVIIRDREREEAKLYTQIQALLEARITTA